MRKPATGKTLDFSFGIWVCNRTLQCKCISRFLLQKLLLTYFHSTQIFKTWLKTTIRPFIPIFKFFPPFCFRVIRIKKTYAIRSGEYFSQQVINNRALNTLPWGTSYSTWTIKILFYDLPEHAGERKKKLAGLVNIVFRSARILVVYKKC